MPITVGFDLGALQLVSFLVTQVTLKLPFTHLALADSVKGRRGDSSVEGRLLLLLYPR